AGRTATSPCSGRGGFQTRALARGAVAGLALGLVTLAALAAWGGTTNAHATAELRSMNQVGRVWSQVFQHIDAENQAAHDFVNVGGPATTTSRRPSGPPGRRWSGWPAKPGRSRLRRWRPSGPPTTGRSRPSAPFR